MTTPPSPRGCSLALVPAQRMLVGYPLEYDLLIRGTGLYAVSLTASGATARPLERPRPRAAAAFHVAADAAALAELLAGVEKRMGRWSGSVRIRGRRGRARALRTALVRCDLSLAAAARAGARLDPDVVFPAFAYAVDPAWTRGHRFTVAQEILDPEPARWHVAVRDGAPLAVTRRPPADRPTPSSRCPAPPSTGCCAASRRSTANGRRSAATAPPSRR